VRLVRRSQVIHIATDGILSQQIAKNEDFLPNGAAVAQQFLALRYAGLKQGAPCPEYILMISKQVVRAMVEATVYTTLPRHTG